MKTHRRLADARLYLVLEARPHGRDPASLLDAALRGGVDVVQLRDKDLPDEELVRAAEPFRRACGAHGALFVLNDRPDLVAACGADGVHVGQADTSVAEARAEVGPDRIVGLSIETEAQLDAIAGADYLGVGAVFATPTKTESVAGGLELVRAAAARVTIPWFAIGGIQAANLAEVVAAGAPGVAVGSSGPSGTRTIRKQPLVRYAPRWVNHPPREPSWKTTVFSPLSSTTSK
jgi:thiamine-phosphate pyrophosphorylase